MEMPTWQTDVKLIQSTLSLQKGGGEDETWSLKRDEFSKGAEK